MDFLTIFLFCFLFVSAFIDGIRLRILADRIDRLDKILAEHLANDPNYKRVTTDERSI